MSSPLFPRHVDNTYRGYRLALWLFALVVLMKVGISLGSIFNGHEAAGSADGIPLDSYTAAGAQTVVALFALLGLANLVLGVLCIVVLLRYRALVPLLFALLLLQQLGRLLVLHYLPIVRTGAPPGGTINLVLLALMVVGVLLSLRRRDALQKPQ